MSQHFIAHTIPAARTFTRYTLAASLALTPLFLATTPAQAGPDDGKMIATQNHIDTPKTFWENGNFKLYAEAPRDGKVSQLDPSQTALWVGKGWAQTPAQEQQYIFTVPDTPAASFLGKPGDQLYAAPSLPMGNHDPAWIGFGADTDIPTEQFRDGSFALDILKVDGPGDVEMFRYDGRNNPTSIDRFLSSKDPGWHSSMLKAGSHTHNYTTFTKPGRYEITYRTVARGKDGKDIESKPTTVVWQVGGQKPIDGKGATTNLNDTAERFNAAPAGNLADSHYKLSLAPKANPAKDGDKALHTISFAADSKVNGKLTLFNNGYFLTDLEVKDGAATWDEMLGSEASNIQAVFTPEGDGAKWVSQPLAFTPGITSPQQVTSDSGQGEWPQQKPDEQNVPLTPGHHALTSDELEWRVEPSEIEGLGKLTVTAKDKEFRGHITGGLYSDLKDESASYPFDTQLNNGTATFYFDNDEWLKGEKLKFTVTPHPDMDAGVSSVVLTDSYEPGQTYTKNSKIPAVTAEAQNPQPTPSDSAPAPAPSGSAVAPAPARPSSPANSHPAAPQPTAGGQNQCKASPFAGKKVLSDGHVDIKGTLQGSNMGLAVKDETRQLDSKTVDRSLNDVVFAVGDQAKHRRTGALKDSAFDFLGPQGSEFYGLPQTQQQGVIWPGYNTQEIDYSKLKGGVKLHIEPQQMPQDAQFSMYQENMNGITTLLSSAEDKSAIDVNYATHVHANWIFSKAGNYSFTTYYTATLADGTEVKSEKQQLSFAVGKQAIADCSTEISDAQKDNVAAAGSHGASEDTGSPVTGADSEHAAASSAEKSDDRRSSNGENNAGTTSGSGSEVEGSSATSAQANAGNGMVAPMTSEDSAANSSADEPGTGGVPADAKCYATEEIVEEATPKENTAEPAAFATLQKISATEIQTVANHKAMEQVKDGHFDFGALLQDGNLKASIKDDRQSPARWVEPEALQFVLGDSAKNKLPAGMEDIGKAGSEVYLIGATQQPGVPWLGWNTQDSELVKNAKGPVTMKLNSVDGPGKMSVFLSGNFGGSGQKVFDSESKGSYKVPLNTHQHGNWVFTKPGVYNASITYSAQLKNGKSVSTTANLTFKVGDGAAQAAPDAGKKEQEKGAEQKQEHSKNTEKQESKNGTVDQSTGIVTRPDGTKVRVVGKTADGQDCTLSPEELAAGQQASAEGKLAYTGAKVGIIAGSSLLLLAAGTVAVVAVRRRHA